ncbi:MAG: hypothetical protein E7324_03085 [Clostridiales bacterium]|nr:hypothetical protein [Clostridiales bacterium]
MKRILAWFRSLDFTPMYLLIAMVDRWLTLHLQIGGSFIGSTYYNTYTLQAMAWRSGAMHLPYDYPALELAIHQGKYFVSFPPVPSLILYPLTFLFGMNTPDNLLVKLYTLIACLAIYFALRKAEYSKFSAGLFAYFFCFASSMLPMTLNGAVWYHAQVLAFMLMILSIACLAREHITLSLLFYALSVGCRPFDAVYGLPIFCVLLARFIRSRTPLKSAMRQLLPGVIAGLCVATGLAVYNYARFGNPLEFGHNHLPEFSFQGGIQFSLAHVANNLKTFLWGAPLSAGPGGVRFAEFGYSFLIACPMLPLMLVWAIVDLIKKHMHWEKAAVIFAFILHLFLLLLHRTFGGYQLGARYTVDLIPYAFLYLMLSPEKKKLHPAEGALLLIIFLFTCWGVTQVHI